MNNSLSSFFLMFAAVILAHLVYDQLVLNKAVRASVTPPVPTRPATVNEFLDQYKG